MNETSWIWIAIASLLIFAILIVGIGQAFGQTNITQPLIVVPQQVATQPQLQGVAQQTDNNTLFTAIAGLVTAVVIPYVATKLNNKTKEVKEKAEQGHEQNELRLEATSETVMELNNSLKATDQGNLEFAKMMQVFVKPFKEHSGLKEIFDKYSYKGTPILQAIDEFIEESTNDIEEYYNGSNDKVDKFDTCNDPIVQKLTAVRNKSKK